MLKELQTNDNETAEATAQTKGASSGCCGGAAPEGADACCALDAEVKATGGSGCGCNSAATSRRSQRGRCC